MSTKRTPKLSKIKVLAFKPDPKLKKQVILAGSKVQKEGEIEERNHLARMSLFLQRWAKVKR